MAARRSQFMSFCSAIWLAKVEPWRVPPLMLREFGQRVELDIDAVIKKARLQAVPIAKQMHGRCRIDCLRRRQSGHSRRGCGLGHGRQSRVGAAGLIDRLCARSRPKLRGRHQQRDRRCQPNAPAKHQRCFPSRSAEKRLSRRSRRRLRGVLTMPARAIMAPPTKAGSVPVNCLSSRARADRSTPRRRSRRRQTTRTSWNCRSRRSL